MASRFAPTPTFIASALQTPSWSGSTATSTWPVLPAGNSELERHLLNQHRATIDSSVVICGILLVTLHINSCIFPRYKPSRKPDRRRRLRRADSRQHYPGDSPRKPENSLGGGAASRGPAHQPSHCRRTDSSDESATADLYRGASGSILLCALAIGVKEFYGC
jgi:hypothetical protein